MSTDYNPLVMCDGKTPLHTASMCGEEVAVKLLLDLGANVEAADNCGRTPLLLAAMCGHVNVMEALYAYGVNLTHKDHHGSSALHLASLGADCSELCTNPFGTVVGELADQE